MRARDRLVLTAAVLAAVGATVKMRSGAADMTLDEAEREARHFLRSTGLPADQPVKRAGQSGTNWEIVVGGCQVMLDIRTGKPTGLANLERSRENADDRRPGSPRRLNERAGAEAFVRGLARRIGVPADWKLESVDLGDEVRARFAEHPFGYPYLSEGIANFAQFTIDARDSALTSASFRWDVVPEPPRQKVTKEKALTVAGAVLKQRGATVLPTNPPTVRLGYALSSRLPLSFHEHPHARLVWEVAQSRDAVWVDAETGVNIRPPGLR